MVRPGDTEAGLLKFGAAQVRTLPCSPKKRSWFLQVASDSTPVETRFIASPPRRDDKAERRLAGRTDGLLTPGQHPATPINHTPSTINNQQSTLKNKPNMEKDKKQFLDFGRQVCRDLEKIDDAPGTAAICLFAEDRPDGKSADSVIRVAGDKVNLFNLLVSTMKEHPEFARLAITALAYIGRTTGLDDILETPSADDGQRPN